MTQRSGWVYILRLQDSCWYVGFSADPETRIASHFLGRGARWTQLHPPLAVESLQPGDEKLEDVVTIALMAKHGFQLVRGGATSPRTCLYHRRPSSKPTRSTLLRLSTRRRQQRPSAVTAFW